MKAVVQAQYGMPEDVLALREIDRPAIGDDEVLVRVRAASMHPDIWHAVTGLPYMLRLMGMGLRTPRVTIPGTDLSGHVESIGRHVTRFRIGDEVFGESSLRLFGYGGTFADTREDVLQSSERYDFILDVAKTSRQEESSSRRRELRASP